jgi:hypothetical protein
MKQFFSDISKTALGVFIGGGALVIAIQIYDSYRIHKYPRFGSIHFDGTVLTLEHDLEDPIRLNF